MALNYNTLFTSQYGAGTGKKRSYPYTGVMAGSAESALSRKLAQEERDYKREQLDVEQERLGEMKNEFNSNYALQEDANDEAKKQAKIGNIISGAGVLVNALPMIKSLFTDTGSSAGIESNYNEFQPTPSEIDTNPLGGRMMAGILGTGATLFGGPLAGLGVGMITDAARRSGSGEEFSWGNLFSDAIGRAAKAAIGYFTPTQEVTKALGVSSPIGQSVAQWGIGQAKSAAINSIYNNTIGRLIGSLQETPSYGRNYLGVMGGRNTGDVDQGYYDTNNYTSMGSEEDSYGAEFSYAKPGTDLYNAGFQQSGTYSQATKSGTTHRGLEDLGIEGYWENVGTPSAPASELWEGDTETGMYGGAYEYDGGGGGGGGGGTVICTELHRQGLIDADFYRTEAKYGYSLPVEIMEGYRAWAIPIVKLMRKSYIMTRIVRFIAQPILNEMAHRADNKYSASLIGSVSLFVALPVCSFIGRSKRTWEVSRWLA